MYLDRTDSLDADALRTLLGRCRESLRLLSFFYNMGVNDHVRLAAQITLLTNQQPQS